MLNADASRFVTAKPVSTPAFPVLLLGARLFRIFQSDGSATPAALLGGFGTVVVALFIGWWRRQGGSMRRSTSPQSASGPDHAVEWARREARLGQEGHSW
jgi:hypothetical protein